MFVAEAEFRASKVFTRSKKGMLALYGTDMHVVDVLGLEAADVSSGSADAASHVLRWVHYIDVSAFGPPCHITDSPSCTQSLIVLTMDWCPCVCWWVLRVSVSNM